MGAPVLIRPAGKYPNGLSRRRSAGDQGTAAACRKRPSVRSVHGP